MDKNKRGINRILYVGIACTIILLIGYVLWVRGQKATIINSPNADFGALNPGIYRITVKYLSESEYNGVFATCNEAKAYQINQDILNTNSPMQLFPNRNSISFRAWAAQPVSDFGVATNYCGLGQFQIFSISIQREPNWGFICLVMGILTTLCLKKTGIWRGMKRETALVLVVLGGIALVASIPNLQNNIIASTDVSFHLYRIEGFRAALDGGQFPVRIQPNWWGYYGYGISLFYPDFFLLIPAILMQLGFTLQGAYKVFLFIASFATAGFSYLTGKSIGGKKTIGLAAAAFYTVALYRITNIYQRGALGEVLAMTFLPVIVLGVYRIYAREKQGVLPGWLVLALGLTGVIESHILSCEMVGVFLVLVILVNLKRTFQQKEIFLDYLKMLGATVVLNAWFIVPFIQSWQGNYVFKTVDKFNQEIQSSGAFVSQIFALFVNGLVPDKGMESGTIGEMPQSVGIWSMMILLVLAGALVYYGKELAEDKALFLLSMQSLVYSLVALFFASNMFPYAWLQGKSGFLNSLLGHLQFPWRFLSIASVCLMLAFICGLKILDKFYEGDLKSSVIWAATSAVLVLNIVGVMYCYHVLLDEEGTVHHTYMEYQAGKLIGGDQTEYLPAEADLSNCDYLPHVDGDKVELPLFYYPLYKAYDENGLELTVEKSARGQVLVSNVVGSPENISVKLKEPILWRMSEAFSFIGVAGVVVYVYSQRGISQNHNRYRQGLKCRKKEY